MMTVIGVAVIMPLLLYIGLELSSVQRHASCMAEKELSRLLGVDVSIGSVSIVPFNRVFLRDVKIIGHDLEDNDTIASIRRIGAGIDLYQLISGNIVVSYAELIGADIRIHRVTQDSPLNIAPVIRALAGDSANKKQSHYDLELSSIVLRRSKLSYDVDSLMHDTTKFDKSHIALRDLRADIRIPRLSNTDTRISVVRLACIEQSGFTLSNLSLNIQLEPGVLSVQDPVIKLPNTEIKLSTLEMPLPSSISGDYKTRLMNSPVNVALLSGTEISPSDFSAFVPFLKQFDTKLKAEADIEGTLGSLELKNFTLSNTDSGVAFEISDCLIDSIMLGRSRMAVDLGRFSLTANGPSAIRFLKDHTIKISDRLSSLISNAGQLSLMCHGTLERGHANIYGDIASDAGAVDFTISGMPFNHAAPFDVSIECAGFKISQLLKNVIPNYADFSTVSLTSAAQLSLADMSGSAALDIREAGFRNMALGEMHATAELSPDRTFSISFDTNNTMATIQCDLNIRQSQNGNRILNFDAEVDHFALELLGDKSESKRSISLSSSAIFEGKDIDDANGYAHISDIHLVSGNNESEIEQLNIEINRDSISQNTVLRSDIMDADINGRYRLSRLAADMKAIAYALIPALNLGDQPSDSIKSPNLFQSENFAEFNLTIKNTSKLEPLIKLPVSVLAPLNINGVIDGIAGGATLDIDAPYLLQGKNIIEKSHISATVESDSVSGTIGSVFLSSIINAKKGNISVEAGIQGFDNNLNAELTWRMDRATEYSGRLDLASQLRRDTSDGSIITDIHFNPGKVVVNDTTWTVAPSDIFVSRERIDIDGFEALGFGNQHIRINGVASKLPEDSIHLSLNRIDLDYIFETLGISNAMFGGRATGNFYAYAALSPTPRLFTDDFYVEGIKYNHCTMGDAKISSYWDVDQKAVVINADITGPHNNVSEIRGMIKPMTEELDFKFHADDVPVGFLLPFMEAFTSDIDGHASGDAHLYGTFKLLDMTGDLWANAFKMKVDFTNCWYETTDSIHLRPGRIEIPGVTLRDPAGHSARFSGLVTHKCFKEPTFDFRITDARDLLVYDMAQSPDRNWSGKIYGDGSASIIGVPGRIDIGVTMATAPGSSFTFVLSDTEEAYNYTFINFRDRNASKDEIVDTSTPKEVREIRKRLSSNSDNSAPSVYDLDITLEVNPFTAVTLVMDPAGGDKIRARGSGTLNMGYNSVDEALDIHGFYTLSEGNYNFTLQDIIIKDFTIKGGSKIEFLGDPFNARLDMQAIYQLNANLTDLDESFQQDKEVSRTNVPIQAILKVSGEISRPDIAFDLNFPTLTDDTYRKVKSIISTDDMMNRQIIYLLALNRFYTPEYMSATKGNELVSVASSTISSQLSNILGQLSDNWTIAPNFRSDRGDFSDVEFDLALSSRLLNNRLLLNGNFGYRDKALNNNSFIGDFDIEYLLNRSGTFRLKAYNRYNDRNFYIKSALTTQGVGIMYRMDFDDIFGIFSRWRKNSTDSEIRNKIINQTYKR